MESRAVISSPCKESTGMKFKVTLKDPDVLNDAIKEAVENEVNKLDSLDEDEKYDLCQVREEKIGELCAKWFEYSEYLTVEIDTDKKTIEVCKAD